MARKRLILSSLDGSEKLRKAKKIMRKECPEHVWTVCWLFDRLISKTDDFGRGNGSIWDIRISVFFDPEFPVSDKQIEIMMKALHKSRLIFWYEFEEKKYYQISNFDKEQAGIIRKRTKSYFPEPQNNTEVSTLNEDISGNSRKFPEIPGITITGTITGTGTGAGTNNIYTPEFEEFCSIFPGKVLKAESLRNWKKLLKNGEKAETLIQAGKNYAEECRILKKEEYFYAAHNFMGQKAYYLNYIIMPQVSAPRQGNRRQVDTFTPAQAGTTIKGVFYPEGTKIPEGVMKE